MGGKRRGAREGGQEKGQGLHQTWNTLVKIPSPKSGYRGQNPFWSPGHFNSGFRMEITGNETTSFLNRLRRGPGMTCLFSMWKNYLYRHYRCLCLLILPMAAMKRCAALHHIMDGRLSGKTLQRMDELYSVKVEAMASGFSGY